MRKLSSHRLGPFLAALIGVACLGTSAARAANLGDIPGNDGLMTSCTKVQFMGPMITAWCTDKNDLTFKSEVDVRSCAGFLVVADASAHLRCRQRLRR